MTNCDLTVPIMWLFGLCIAWVILYFFVHKQNQAERQYEEQMKKINSIGNGYF